MYDEQLWNNVEQVLKILALVGALVFFAYKLGNGVYVPSVSVSLKASRHSQGNGSDLLLLEVCLRVGSVSTVDLHTIEARVSTGGPGVEQLLSVVRFPGLERPGHERQPDGRLQVIWTDSGRLRTRQGEEPSFSATVAVPKESWCFIELAVIGQRAFAGFMPSIWKVTAYVPPHAA